MDDELKRFVKKVHSKDSGEHQGDSRIFKLFSHLVYLWPSWRLMLLALLEGAKHVSSTAESALLQLNYTVYLQFRHLTLRSSL